jgi:hypothetical protein
MFTVKVAGVFLETVRDGGVRDRVKSRTFTLSVGFGSEFVVGPVEVTPLPVIMIVRGLGGADEAAVRYKVDSRVAGRSTGCGMNSQVTPAMSPLIPKVVSDS